MIKVEKLIQELCPNGVEFKKLDEVFIQFSGLTGVTNKWAEEGNCLFIDYMNAYKNISIDVDKLAKATIKNFDQTKLKQGDILFTSASETPDECAISSVIENEIQENVYLDDHLFGIRLKSEYEKEYNNRKFNNWHKWNRPKSAVQIKLPDIDTITKNTLVYIVNTYPELAEQYLDFLGTLGIDFDNTAPELNLDKVAAEKYIVSLKLQRYIEKLNLTKSELIKSGDESVRDEIIGIDSDIAAAHEKLEKLIML